MTEDEQQSENRRHQEARNQRAKRRIAQSQTTDRPQARRRPRLSLLLWQADETLKRQWWPVALVSFLAIIIILAAIRTSEQLHIARSQIKSELTIQIPTGETGIRIDVNSPLLDQVQEILRTTDGIKQTRLLSFSEVQDILRPWVGESVDLTGLPVPYIIAAKRVPTNASNSLDILALKGQLSALNPGIVVDDHRATLSEINRVIRLCLLATAAAYVLMIAIMLAISFSAASTAMHLQKSVLDVLFLAGASDGYIAGQVVGFAIDFTSRGMLVGGGLGIVSYVSAMHIFGFIAVAGPWLSLSVVQLLAIAGLVAIVVMMIAFASHSAAIRHLERLY